jgi:hypothetical protein
MAKIEGQHPLAGRARPAVAAIVILGLAVAACGGGGGGGNGDRVYTLRVSFANETEAEATLALNDANPQAVESCTGGVYSWEMPPEGWVLTVNGETAIDSLEYDPSQLDNNVVARAWLHEDGTVELIDLAPGASVNAPTVTTICL